jgi:hypothetical protein
VATGRCPANLHFQDQRDGRVELLGEVEATGSVLAAEEMREVCHSVHIKMINGMAPNFESETFWIETYHYKGRGRLCKMGENVHHYMTNIYQGF